MKKLVIMLMMVLSMVTFGQTFKEAMNDNRIGGVRIAGVIKTRGGWKYMVTDNVAIGFLEMGPNDANTVMKTDDPTLLPGAGKRNFEGWTDAAGLQNWMYEQGARGFMPDFKTLGEWRVIIKNSGKKNAQKSRL